MPITYPEFVANALVNNLEHDETTRKRAKEVMVMNLNTAIDQSILMLTALRMNKAEFGIGQTTAEEVMALLGFPTTEELDHKLNVDAAVIEAEHGEYTPENPVFDEFTKLITATQLNQLLMNFAVGSVTIPAKHMTGASLEILMSAFAIGSSR